MSGYGPTRYAVDMVLDEVRDIVSLATASIPLPAQPTEDDPTPDDRPLVLYTGESESEVAALQWPVCVINADNGRGGRMRTGDDRRVVVRITIGIYMQARSDYRWLSRLCDLVTDALLPYERVSGRSSTLDQKDTAVRWVTVDDIDYPLAAGQVICEVRLPTADEVSAI